MSFLFTPPSAVLAAAALVSAAAAGPAWRLRARSPGSPQFAAMMIGVVIWCAMEALEAAAVGLPAKLLFSTLAYIGICSVTPLFAWFAFEYGGVRELLTPRSLAALWAIPVVTLGLVITNTWHRLVWSAVTPDVSAAAFNVFRYHHGPWYAVWVGWCALATAAATLVLMRASLHRGRFYLRQALVFLAVAVLPWIGEEIGRAQNNLLPGLDYVPVGFALAGGLLLTGMWRFKLLDVVPVARADIVDSVSEGIVALDAASRIVDVNRAAMGILGVGPDCVGRSVEDTFAAVPDLLLAVRTTGPELRRLVAPGPGSSCRYELVVTSMGRGRGAGKVLVLRAAPPEGSPRELLPVCASCRRVRDGSGRWISLERYVSDRWRVQPSHGICDDCITKLYPEVDLRREPR